MSTLLMFNWIMRCVFCGFSSYVLEIELCIFFKLKITGLDFFL